MSEGEDTAFCSKLTREEVEVLALLPGKNDAVLFSWRGRGGQAENDGTEDERKNVELAGVCSRACVESMQQASCPSIGPINCNA